MPDLEKVVAGLECCTQSSIECDSNCPYAKVKNCYDVLMDDARALLKAQEPRVLTAWDFVDNPDADAGGAIPCWKESKSPTRRSGWAVICYGKWLGDTEGGTCRYWTGKPTEEQRRGEPWQE